MIRKRQSSPVSPPADAGAGRRRRLLSYSAAVALVSIALVLPALAGQARQRRTPRPKPGPSADRPELLRTPILKDASKVRRPAIPNDPLLAQAPPSPPLPYALTGQTELRVLYDQGPEFQTWQTSLDDVVSWRLPANRLNLQFYWSTKQPGIKSGLWQVSLLPFDPNMRDWRNPPGLVASGPLTELPQPGKIRRFNIDFSKFAVRPKIRLVTPKSTSSSSPPAIRVGTSTASAGQAAATSPPPIRVRRSNPSANQTAKPRRLPTPSTPGRPQTIAARRAARAAEFRKVKLNYRQSLAVIRRNQNRFRYYVRVVPLAANGERVGLPSTSVTINYGEPPPPAHVEIIQGVQPQYVDAVHPVVSIAEYYPVQIQDPGAFCYVIVTRDPFAGTMAAGQYYVGRHLDLHVGPKSWWEEFWDTLTSFFDFVKGAINWVADAYNSIKEAVVNLATVALPDELKGPFSAAVDVGLASMGIPPSVPNFDELTNLGEGYLVKEIADQTGVPEDVAKAGMDALISKARDTANGAGHAEAWTKPDPAYYYRPAFLKLTVSNPFGSVSEAVTLSVKCTGTKYDVYETAQVPVPPLNAGERISIPVFLKENTGPGYVTSDPASYKWPTQQTFDAEYYNLRKVTFAISTTVDRWPTDPAKPQLYWRNATEEQQTLQLDTMTYYAGQ